MRTFAALCLIATSSFPIATGSAIAAEPVPTTMRVSMDPTEDFARVAQRGYGHARFELALRRYFEKTKKPLPVAKEGFVEVPTIDALLASTTIGRRARKSADSFGRAIALARRIDRVCYDQPQKDLGERLNADLTVLDAMLEVAQRGVPGEKRGSAFRAFARARDEVRSVRDLLKQHGAGITCRDDRWDEVSKTWGSAFAFIAVALGESIR